MDEQLFRIDLGYDGTDFSGSQRQPGRRTVQGVLEDALSRVTGQPVTVVLAGRTDRGVHAVGQVASGTLVWRHAPETLVRALNAVLPADVVVYGVQRAPDGFHARRSARYREYRYRVWEGARPPVLLRRYVWHVPGRLDVDALRAASVALVGTRDFATFAGKGMGVPTAAQRTVRRVHVATWAALDTAFEPLGDGGRLLEFRIGANAFLPHMVRNIVGALVLVGTGRQPPGWFAGLLDTGDRRMAPPPAPPQGLTLWSVVYEGESIPAGTNERTILYTER